MPGCVTAPGSAACACKFQLASLLACQMPLRFGFPSTRAGRAVAVNGVCPDIRVMDTEMTALAAAAAMATLITERENRPRMWASFKILRDNRYCESPETKAQFNSGAS